MTQFNGVSNKINANTVIVSGNTFSGILSHANTADRTYTLPNNTGTVALLTDIHVPVTLGTANGLSLSTQTLSLGLASSGVTGALSGTDWNTFNSKQAAYTNLTTFGSLANAAGYLYNDGSGVLSYATSSGGVSSFNTRTGVVTLTSSDVTTALTYTPINKSGDTGIGNLSMGALTAAGDIVSTGNADQRQIGFNLYGSQKYNLFVDGAVDADKMSIRRGTTEVVGFSSVGAVTFASSVSMGALSATTGIFSGGITSVLGGTNNGGSLQATNFTSGAYGSIVAQGSNGNGLPGWSNSFVIEGVPASGGNTVIGSYTGSLIFQVNNRTINALTLNNTGAATFTSSVSMGALTATTIYGKSNLSNQQAPLNYVYIGSTDDNVTDTVVLLHPAYNGTIINKYLFDGTITFQRGGTGSYNVSDNYDVKTSTAYSSNAGSIISRNTQRVANLITCTYNSVLYVAIYVSKTSARDVYYKGDLLSTLTSPLVLSASSVSNVSVLTQDNTNLGAALSVNGDLTLTTAPDQYVFGIKNGLNRRWSIYTTGAETGSNAGSSLAFAYYTDSGTYVGSAFTFNRATAAATFASSVSMGALSATTGTFSGTVTVGSRGRFYDDGNFHVQATSSPLWLESADNSPVYINWGGGQTLLGGSLTTTTGVNIGQRLWVRHIEGKGWNDNSTTGDLYLQYNLGGITHITGGCQFHNASQTIVAAIDVNGNISGATGTFSSSISAPNAVTGGASNSQWGKCTTNLADFNQGLPSGFYDGSNATGAPSVSWFHLINSAHSNSYSGNQYQLQIAADFWDQEIYFRKITPSTLTPVWTRYITSVNLGNTGLAIGGTTGTFSGALTANNGMNVNRSNSTYTGILYYSSGFTAWQTYMSNAGVASGVSGTIVAPTGTYVTTWGLRNFIENNAGYGWTWESGTSTSTTPSIVAELSSNTGNFRTIGSISATSFSGAGTGLTGTANSLTAGNATLPYAAGGNTNTVYLTGFTTSGTGYNYLYTNSPVYMSAGTVYATNFGATSDERLKTNITPILNPIDKVKNLNGFYFNWNELAPSLDKTTTHVGVSAQHTLKAFPEAVVEGEEYLSVTYNSFIPLLIECVKEQQKEIEELKRLINDFTK